MLSSKFVSAVKGAQRLGSLSLKSANSAAHLPAVGWGQWLSPVVSSLLNHPVMRSYSVRTPATSLPCTSLLSSPTTSHLGLLQPKPVTLDLVRFKFIPKKWQNIKFSFRKGKRKTMKIVLEKFYRLNWGCWIHGKCGRSKSLYKKSAQRRRRLQQHVMCNATQSWLLDKMVTRYWRRPKHYVDDPYEPYHSREEFKYTRMKPWQPYA